jgi:hypothetical protein
VVRVDTATIYKAGDKRDCGNYRRIPVLSTTYKILSNILMSRLLPYAEKASQKSNPSSVPQGYVDPYPGSRGRQ